MAPGEAHARRLLSAKFVDIEVVGVRLFLWGLPRRGASQTFSALRAARLG